MIRSVRLAAALACALASAVACSNAPSDHPEGAAPSATGTRDSLGVDPPVAVGNPQSSTVPAHDTVSAHAVFWTVDLVLARLSSGGKVATVTGPVQAKHMSVPGTVVHVAGADLEVYIYSDANATAQDVDRFDRLMRMPDRTLMWQKPPALITANNLVVLVLTPDPAVRDRIRRAVGVSR